MGDYSTVKFLGATVVTFSSSVGWNDDISSLNVTLVEDDVDDDNFDPPITGFPVTFNFMGWVFSGLLEKWTRSASSQGELINVSVVDPRNLLDGVAVILDAYTGSANISNIINAYGYLEDRYGFGGSGKNDSGIPYLLVGEAILACVNSVSGNSFGGPIRYKGISYGLDISNLPLIPAIYRVGGSTKLSLMEVLRDICEAGGCEMFFRLEGTSTLPIIKLYTISRAKIPNIGIINQFVAETQGAVSKEVGLEMVNDVCAKFLVGGKREDIFYQTYGGGDDGDLQTGIDNTIWPYWGRSLDGDLMYGDGLGIEHTFPIDVRGMQVAGVTNPYYTDVGELIAVLSGYDAWAGYLWLNWANRYRIDATGGESDSFLKIDKVFNSNIPTPIISTSTSTYFHRNIRNPHYLKAINLGISGGINANLISIIFGSNDINLIKNLNEKVLFQKFPNIRSNLSLELFNNLELFANEFFGIKFMVRIPSVLSKLDTDTLKYTTNVLPRDTGWLDTGDIATQQQANRLAANFYWITDSDNKIKAFARFPNIANLNFSSLASDQVCLSMDGQFLFVHCMVEPDFVFRSNTNKTDARAVITLPGIVQTRTDPNIKGNILRYWIFKGVEHALFGQQQAEIALLHLIEASNLGLNYLANGIELPVIPDMVGIPLESQTSVYGPWYISSSIGKTEMEQDDSLVPWNFGSNALLDQAGFVKVQDINVGLQNLEYGSLEFPGVPSLSLGDQLMSSGPYVTDINVDISTNGVTTRYNMKSWSPKFGKLAKYTSDRFFKMRKQLINLEREIAMLKYEVRRQ